MADDRLTNFYVDYNIEDTTAKQDADFSCTGEQKEFTNISRIRYVNKDLRLDRFTFEQNFNVLDGSLTELENDSHNPFTFSNTSSVINSIIFKESDDNTVTVRSSSKVTHEEAVYSKTIQIPGNNDNTLWYVSGCPAGGSDSTYKISLSLPASSVEEYGDGATIRVTGNPYVTINIHVATDYFVGDPLVFYPVISTTPPPYVRTVVPFFTDVRSNEQGDFSYWEQYDNDYPIVTINFTREHSSAAFVLRFLDDHPLEIGLKFYSLNGEMITSFTQEVRSNEVVINHDVAGYAKIEVEFLKTLPFRFVKFSSFIFGIIVTWDETNVRNATLVQQTDRLSKNISIDTLSFTVIDDTSDLNLGNPRGINAYFQKNQYMLPYEIINGNKVPLGKYYLKTFSESTNLGKMSAQSYLGIMDDVTFNDGEVYVGTPAGEVIEQIFQTMGLTDYTIDAQTYEQPLYGTITPKSCRKALNEVLFATNSVINAHDVDNVIITKTSEVQRPDIPKGSKFSTTVTKNDYTYGVDVKYTSYVKEDEPKEIIKAAYDAGVHTVYFTQPYSDLTIENGTIDYTKTNYFYVTFTSNGTPDTDVVISGYAYSTITNSQKAVQKKLKAGEEERIVSYSTALCNSKTARELANKILTYLNYDLTIKIKWMADGNDMGDLHIVENPVEGFNDYYGVFTKRSFDLTGGFIDTAEMSGTSLQHSIYKYTRETNIELYSGEDDGII